MYRNLLILFALVLMSFHGRAQYAECHPIAGYGALLDKNAAGEFVMLSNYPRYIGKYSSQGSVIWSDTISSFSIDHTELLNDGTTLVLIPPYNSGPVLRKYNSVNKQVLWQKPFSASGAFANIKTFSIDAQGNPYVVGDTLNTDGSTDLVVRKLAASNGAVVWSKRFHHSIGLNATNFVVSPGGDIYTSSTVLNKPHVQELFKITTDGDSSWVRTFNTISTAIDLDSNGTIYLLFSDYPYSQVDKVSSDGTVSQGGPLPMTSAIFEAGTDYVTLLGLPTGPIETDSLMVVSVTSQSLSFNAQAFINEPVAIRELRPLFMEFTGDGSLYVTAIGFGSLGTEGSLVQKFRVSTGKMDSTWQFIHKGWVEGGFENGAGNFTFALEDCRYEVFDCDQYPLVLTVQPTTKTVCPNDNTSFSVSATGAGLRYYWYKNNERIIDGGNIQGAEASTLTIKNTGVGETGNYYCEVRDGCGTMKTSNSVSLQLKSIPTVAAQPIDKVSCVGESATFEISVNGGVDVTYQWKHGGVVIPEGSHASGTKTRSLKIIQVVDSDAGQYYCEVLAGCLTSPIISQSATLTFNNAAVITKQPQNASVCSGADHQFTIEASGTGLQFQWKKDGQILTDNNKITGAKTSSLSLFTISDQDKGNYQCEIKGSCNDALSNVSSLSIGQSIAITQHPKDAFLCDNQSAIFSVAYTGTATSVQWSKDNTPLTNGGRISGSTSTQLTIAGALVSDEGFYTCTITSDCNAITTLTAELNLSGTTGSIVSQTGDLSVCEDGVAQLSITTTGDVQTYAWSRNGSPLTDNSKISGTDTRTLTIRDVISADNGAYVCVIKTGCDKSASSDPMQLSVTIKPEIENIAGDQRICEEETLKLAISAASTNAIRWRKNGLDLIDSDRIKGSSTSSISIANIQQGDAGYYSAVVSGCAGEQSTSTINITVSVKPDLHLILNCSSYPNEATWANLVQDSRQTFGEYTLYQGENFDHVVADVNFITSPGLYYIVKETQYCADTLKWLNDCEATVTAINDHSIQTDVEISPNPAKGWMKLSYSWPAVKDIGMINAQGAVVISTRLEDDGDTMINIENLPSGVYGVISYGDNRQRSLTRIVILN